MIKVDTVLISIDKYTEQNLADAMVHLLVPEECTALVKKNGWILHITHLIPTRRMRRHMITSVVRIQNCIIS
jgi:hypothetical protein